MAQSRQESHAVLLKAKLWLQHVVDTSNSDREVSFSEYWAAETLRAWPELCCLCAVRPPVLGAHVMSMHAGVGVVIVPACAECNSNSTKTIKFAEVKFDVWAARVTKSELQRIERQQRLNARHQRDEAKLALIRSLPEVGVPVKIAAPLPRRPSERGRQHRHDCQQHFVEPCPCGRRVQYPTRAAATSRLEDYNVCSPAERTPTPRPPSPLTDPEVIDLTATRRLAPIGSSSHITVSDDEDRVTGILADMLLGSKPAAPPLPQIPAPSPSPSPSPRPQRRSLKPVVAVAAAVAAAVVAPASKTKPLGTLRKASAVRQQADAMQTIGRCKFILGDDADDDDSDSEPRFCNQLTCSKRPECPGSSKGYCCSHCKCKHCVKPPRVAAAAAAAAVPAAVKK